MNLSFQGSHWQNSNFQLTAWVAGKAHTAWEKYRLLCNQIENRKMALAIVAASEKRRIAKMAKLKYLQEHGTEWECLELEAEMLEADAGREVGDRCVEAARSEVEAIESLIRELELELEATRIPGYTDQMMFQHIQSEEWARELLHRAENSYISKLFGGFPPEQIDAMRSHPLFESQILPALKRMHAEFMPAIAQANTLQIPQSLPPVQNRQSLTGVKGNGG